MRFPLEVVDAVRAVWPENHPLAVALNVTDGVSGGLTVEDGVAIARELKDHGCDLITVMAGQTTPASVAPYRRGFLTPLADRVRNEADIPTMVGGYLLTSNEANTLLAAGRADMCLLEYPWPEDGIIPETSPSTDETLNRPDTRSTKRHTKQEARHGR
jgi:anthraniloyl-CoA monooxygenase